MNAAPHVRPSECPTCLEMLQMARRVRYAAAQDRHLLTWCLVCGEPTKVKVAPSYVQAVAYFHALDRQPMGHASNNPHAERDGWGHHWRLDEVLRVAFPVESAHDSLAPYWPYPGWYDHTESANCQVQPITPTVFRLLRPSASETDRMLMKDKINLYPRVRKELERESGRVWDENQFKRSFTFMGAVGPFVIVMNHETDEQGTLIYQEEPRYYWGFSTDRVI